MENQRPSFALRLLPSMADFACLIPLFFLFARMAGTATLLQDGDTGWHIRTGQWILAHHRVPFEDLFSFSKAGAPWFAWEWGSDVLMASLNALGGLRLLVLAAAFLIAAVFALLYKLALRRSNPIVAVGLTVLAAAASSLHFLARPHLFTFLFVPLFWAALEEMRNGRERLWRVPYVAILPLATVVWTNLHGGFVIGIILIAAYGVGELLHWLLGPESGRPEAARLARRFFLTAAASLAASLLNPYFFQLHVHIARYLADPFNSEHIEEFLSPSFHMPQAPFFEAMLVMGAAAACWNLLRGRYTEVVLFLLMAHAGLLAIRNIPLFMVVATPMVAGAIQEFLNRLPEFNVAAWLRRAVAGFNRLAARTAETEAAGRWHLASIGAIALIAALIYAPHPPEKFRAEFSPKIFPAGALRVLRNDPSSRIFTKDQWGDYLIWSLNHKVFVDGRSDFYGDDFENKVLDIFNVRNGWEKILNRFGVDTILLPADAPLAGALKESAHWRVVYDDHIALVFRPASTGSQQTLSASSLVGGISRDREITKLERDPAITGDPTKSKKPI